METPQQWWEARSCLGRTLVDVRQDGLQRRRGRARAQRGQRAACADLRGWRPAAVRGMKALACRRAGCVRAVNMPHAAVQPPSSCKPGQTCHDRCYDSCLHALCATELAACRGLSVCEGAHDSARARARPCQAAAPAGAARCRRPRRLLLPSGMRPRARPSPPAPACGTPLPALTPTHAGCPSSSWPGVSEVARRSGHLRGEPAASPAGQAIARVPGSARMDNDGRRAPRSSWPPLVPQDILRQSPHRMHRSARASAARAGPRAPRRQPQRAPSQERRRAGAARPQIIRRAA